MSSSTLDLRAALEPVGLSERERGLFAAKLMEHLAVAAFVLDRSGRVLIWNKACERLTGVLAAEMLGTSDHWKALYGERRPCLADLLLEERLAEASALYEAWSDTEVNPGGLSAENWCVMPGLGKRYYLAFDAGPIYDDQGRIIAVVETLRDMTARKQMETELQTLAGHDALTSIANRRAFDMKLSEEWLRSKRMSAPLSLLLVDVDYFKQFNDANGHVRGDECLKAVARCVQSQACRAGDLAARIGGEEFGIILPQTPADGAVAVAERLRQCVEDAREPHGASPISPYVTVSIGAMTMTPDEVAEIEKLVETADRALYEAKELGRNCVVNYSAFGSGRPPPRLGRRP